MGKFVTGSLRSIRAFVAIAAASIAFVAPSGVCGADGKTAAAAPNPNASPGSVVDALHAEPLNVMMNAGTLGYQGRYDELAKKLPALFDIPFMAEKSVGRYWKTADEEERQHLLKTFTEFTIANYAGNFDGYTGETFETLEEVESTHGTRLVRSRLNESDGDEVQLDYRLRPEDGGWKIIDIYLNGTVSELALRRSEYSALIQREGFDSLIVALDEKITELSK